MMNNRQKFVGQAVTKEGAARRKVSQNLPGVGKSTNETENVKVEGAMKAVPAGSKPADIPKVLPEYKKNAK